MLDRYFPVYALSFLAVCLLTVLLERRLLPLLSKSARQPIYDEGPVWHLKKSGTPTMGGLAFLLAVLLVSAACIPFLHATEGRESALSLLLSLSFSLANAAVGALDDMAKLRRGKNMGLTPWQKLILQFFIVFLFLYARHTLLGEGTTLFFSFGAVDLGGLYDPLCALLTVGMINFANLTDGVDGLAASVAFGAGIALFYISSALSGEGSLLAALLLGAALGFLVFNLHPARIFMGDTGSLFFGALVCSASFSLRNPLLVVPIGAVYILEGASVVLQVLSFKLCGRRIFKMAPLHHHLEKCGWSENRICLLAVLLTLLFSLPAYILYLP